MSVGFPFHFSSALVLVNFNLVLPSHAFVSLVSSNVRKILYYSDCYRPSKHASYVVMETALKCILRFYMDGVFRRCASLFHPLFICLFVSTRQGALLWTVEHTCVLDVCRS